MVNCISGDIQYHVFSTSAWKNKYSSCQLLKGDFLCIGLLGEGRIFDENCLEVHPKGVLGKKIYLRNTSIGREIILKVIKDFKKGKIAGNYITKEIRDAVSYSGPCEDFENYITNLEEGVNNG